MADWRDIKREARAVVHDTMALAGQYYADVGVQPVAVRARLSTRFTQIGDDRSMGWAEIEAVKPRLIFMLSELPTSLTLARGAIFYLQPGEAYQIDNLLPPDDITVTAEVTRLSRKQYADAQLP